MLTKIIKEDVTNILTNIEQKRLLGKTVLITGATGFFGQYFVHVLMHLNKNYPKLPCKVLALCRSKSKGAQIFSAYLDSREFELLIQDVTAPLCIHEPVDFVVHTAGNANTHSFYKEPVKTMLAHSEGTLRLLQFAQEKKVEGFLFLSSGAVYGDTSHISASVQETESFLINHLESSSFYAQAKRMGEAYCVAFAREYGLCTKIARIAHTYGPTINLNDGRVFSDFVKNIVCNTNLVLKSDGSEKRPFCYITDAMLGLFSILFHGESGQAYNLANEECLVSISQLANALTTEAFPEKHLKVIYATSIPPKANQAYTSEYTLDTTKLQALGWRATVGIVEGFQRTVESFYEEGVGG